MNTEVSSKILRSHYEKKKKDVPNLSSHWLAKKLGISQAYISHIITGKRTLPGGMISQICEILDIDQEKQEILTYEALKAQGWKQIPSKKLREAEFSISAHTKFWDSAPLKDLPKLSEYKTLLVLEATQLKDFDGDTKSLAKRLGMSEEEVSKELSRLNKSGYLKKIDGKLRKSVSLLELQSKMKKKDIVKYHKNAMERAQKIMDEKTEENDYEKRLISSSIFTCSKDQVSLLRVKMAEFLKEISAEAASEEAEEVYQLGLMFFPLSESKE